MAGPDQQKLLIEGMDCAACALKIETAIKRLSGVSNVEVSYAAGTLLCTVDPDRTSLDLIQDKIKALGYHAATPDPLLPFPQKIQTTRQQEKKLRLFIITGALASLSFLGSLIIPEIANWLYTTAALFCILPFARRAFAAARSGAPFTIETLMTVAALGAVLIGEAAEAVVVITLFALGEFLETLAAARARAGVQALIDLIPRTAYRISDNGGITPVPAQDLSVGDKVMVRPGDRIPSDGIIETGSSAINEAPVSGESTPVFKTSGEKVLAGSINTDSELTVRITHPPEDNTIARIIRLVETAQSSKAPTARLIDRFSQVYTPLAMLTALLVMVIPPLLFGADWMTWVYRGLATLLIACPCALVISTPAAIASGLAAGARRGLLIKGGAALETLGKVRTIAFDKTGTLTKGHPQITDIVPYVGTPTDLLSRAAAVEGGVNHPVGTAIVSAANTQGLAVPRRYGNSVALPGKAATARLRTGFVTVGSPSHTATLSAFPPAVSEHIQSLEADGKTVVVVTADGLVEGIIALRDEPREDAIPGIQRLKHRGLNVLMLSGDNQRTADAIGRNLGIEARGQLLPDGKLAEIQRLMAQGPVAMAGDGINDAPALATASVGIAMGGGTDVALETADAALLRDRVEGIAELIGLSRATMGNIRQNLIIALGLKAAFLLTTLLGVTSLWMAILADTGATVLVTANALRLLAFRPSF